jgi:hypothetical protein
VSQEKRHEAFADELEEREVFARRYATDELHELYEAAKTVHSHLCRLGLDHQRKARKMTLEDFANAYALAAGGLWVFTDRRDDR